MAMFAPMLAGGAISTLGSIFGGRSQRRAAAAAAQAQREAYERNSQMIAPWQQAGVNALNQLGDNSWDRQFRLADFMQDPSYAFRQQEGQRALEASQAARGGLMSGPAAMAAMRYNSDLASQEYGNAYNRFNNERATRFNRLNTLAGFGQNAVNALVGNSSNYGNQQAQNAYNVGNINANMYGSIGNALGGAFNSMGGYNMMMGMRGPQGMQMPNWGSFNPNLGSGRE